jgi:2-hydroxychromene-2-carboxylate isomerase
MPAFPLFLKRGANRISALINTSNGQILEEAFSGTPQGKKILTQTCAEAMRLGLLGIPTWIA